MSTYTNMTNYASEIMYELGKQKENILLEQLNELVSRNLLVIEQTEPVLVHDEYSTKITLQQKVRLVLKDQEYIEKLEKENKELKEKWENLSNLISGVSNNIRG